MQLIFIRLLSSTCLHLSSFYFNRALLILHITMSSANIISHEDSCLISCVSLSITKVNKKGLRADPGGAPPPPWSAVTPTAHFTAVLQTSFISVTTIIYFSPCLVSVQVHIHVTLKWKDFSNDHREKIVVGHENEIIIKLVVKVSKVCHSTFRKIIHNWPWGECGMQMAFLNVDLCSVSELFLYINRPE